MITIVEMYNRVLQIKGDGVKSKLAEDTRMPVEILERLVQEELEKLEKEKSAKVLNKMSMTIDVLIYKLAGNKSTPVEMLRKLGKFVEKAQRSRSSAKRSVVMRLEIELAKNEATPVEILEKIAENDYSTIMAKYGVLENPSTPLEILEKVKRYENADPIDRDKAYARNPLTSKDILKDLAKDGDDVILRGTAAKNPSMPKEVLEELAKDESAYIRGCVAQNPSTPVEILEELARDDSEHVRKEVAQNLSTPVGVLEKLSEDPDDKVVMGVAKNPSTPVEVLEKLAKIGNFNPGLALNPSTPIKILEEFAQDEEMYIYLIRNSTIQELARGNSEKKESPEERDDEDTSITKIVDEIKGLIVQDEMLDAEIQKMNDLKQGDLSK